jgi:peroxiredoxin
MSVESADSAGVRLEMAPKPGMLLPAFSLPEANGEREISLWDYKPRRNLALLFVNDVLQQEPLLHAIAQHYSEYRELNAEVLVISPKASERGSKFQSGTLPFPILFDKVGELRRKCLGSGTAADSQSMALIADRWGEVYGKMILREHSAVADEEEIRKWLQFVDMQCEECFPPEWPVTAREQ